MHNDLKPPFQFSYGKGDLIGSYRIIREIGQGGMGSVFLAKQFDPVAREVAIKIMRIGSDSAIARTRFRLESKALAMMNHPNIASVYDAGTTESGHPYIVMEYVEGEPFLSYCDRHKLNLEKRIYIFIRVLDAIHHAHQKGIIHRDIKPGNVIVCEKEGKAVPIVIDFGTAKALEASSENMKRETSDGQVVGTPMYMSPEQVTGNDSRIDIRTDIYALGLLFYELLCGVSALSTEDMGQIQIFHTILTTDPEKPSLRIKGLNPQISANRSMDAPALERKLKGELDWIILRAVEKNPNHRYGSVPEFLMDIVRYLKKEPILAGPPTALYKIKKFIIRNKILVSFFVCIVSLLLAGVAGTSIGMVKALDAKKRAESSEVKAVKAVEYLQKILASADPFKDGRRIRVVELLEKASKEMNQDLKNEPEFIAAMRYTLGWTFLELGLYERSGNELEEAGRIQQKLLGQDHPDTLKTMNALGRLAYKTGNYTKAQQLLRTNWEIQKKVLGPEHNQTLWTQYTLAKTIDKLGQRDEAEILFRKVLESREKMLGPEHPSFLVTVNSLCLLLSAQGKFLEAEQLQVDSLGKLKKTLGETHPTTLNSASNLAVILRKKGLWNEAEKLAARTYEKQVRILGENHPESMSTLFNQGYALLLLERFAEAEKILEQCLQRRTNVLGALHPDTLICSTIYADTMAGQEKMSIAKEYYHSAYMGWRKLDDATLLDLVSEVLIHYSVFLEKSGDLIGARELLEEMDSKLNSKIEKDHIQSHLRKIESK